jgi:hypothetical protein
MTQRLFDELLLETKPWLLQALNTNDLCTVVPVGDPLRVWWDPKAENPVGQLLDFIRGADDSLTLIALIHRARIKGGMCSPPDCLETLLSGVLNQVAQLHRTRAYLGAYHVFLSY